LGFEAGLHFAAGLFGDDFGGDFLDQTALQLAELERTIPDADQPVYPEAEMFHDAPDLAILAFLQRYAEPAIIAPG